MSYHVNASSKDGAMSVPALTLEQAFAKAEEFKAKGYIGVIIVDAGTGEPLRGHAAATMTASPIAIETPSVSPVEDNSSSHETNDLIVALQATPDDQ